MSDDDFPDIRDTFRDPGIDLAGFFEDKAKWSRDTFGEELTVAGLIHHLKKELKEVEADPTDIEEWVDVIFLALDGIARSGHSGKALILAMVAKHQKNRKRTWLYKGEGHFEHDREA